MEFLLGVSLFTNVIVLTFVYLFIREERKEKKDLLNRVMAKDYHQYACFEEHKEVKPLIEEDQEAYQVI